MRLIDADDLRETLLASKYIGAGAGIFLQNLEIDRCIEAIDNAPTVCNDNYSMGYQDGIKKVLSERPQEEILKELWNCRNELCLKCERYKEAWNGACNDCRYNFENMEKWKGEQE